MDYSILEKSSLFCGISSKELRCMLESVPHKIQRYDRGETVFCMMEEAMHIGILIAGRVQTRKPFPNGSRINVSVRNPGDMIGPAAAFSVGRRYPCDVMAIEPVTVMLFRREDVLLLMQKDIRILENFTTETASAAFMLQQRLELLSYSGIAQKIAFYLLIHARQNGSDTVRIPESVSNWALVMNVSRSSLHRELKKLEAKGFISYAPPMIAIRDREGLLCVLSR